MLQGMPLVHESRQELLAVGAAPTQPLFCTPSGWPDLLTDVWDGQIKQSVLDKLVEADSPSTPEEVHQAIVQLVDAHYIERAPPCNLPELSTPPHPKALVRGQSHH